MKHRQVQALCEGAVMVAAAQALGYLKLYEMPNGGSVSFIMLPIIIYCVRWGFGRGLLAALALGTLQFLLDGGFALTWVSILGDYVIAYGALGAAGLFSKAKGGFFWGTAAGTLARFLVIWVVGATVWAEYMPDAFLNMTMTSPWLYSAIYNGIYVGLCGLLCLVVGAAAWRTPLGKYLRAEDLRQ